MLDRIVSIALLLLLYMGRKVQSTPSSSCISVAINCVVWRSNSNVCIVGIPQLDHTSNKFLWNLCKMQ